MKEDMDFKKIAGHVGEVPFMPPERGQLVYEFVRKVQPDKVLELGFAHGTSSCYIAAAMQENGKGKLTTIDNKSARDRTPDIFSLMEKTGLGDFIEPVFTERSYNWELMKMLERNSSDGRIEAQFDLVFIDGGHTWDSDGFAFLLSDRLLKPGGWVLLDDVAWMPSENAGEDWVEAMPEEERDVAHVEKIFKLLVMTNENYENFEFDGHWAWAQKKQSQRSDDDRGDLVRDIYARTNSARRSYLLRRYLKKIFRLS